MSNSNSNSTTTDAPRAPRNFRRGYRGRGGNGNARRARGPESSQSAEAPRPPQSRSVAQTPTSTPTSQPQPVPSQAGPSNTNMNTAQSDAPAGPAQRSKRGPRRGRRGRGGGAAEDGQRQRIRGGEQQTGGPEPRRTFQGRLTKSNQVSEDDTNEGLEEDPGLRADAPVFVPGAEASSSTTTPSGKGKSKAKNPNPSSNPRTRAPKVATKSEAHDMITRIHEDIAHNLYECPICTVELGRKSRVWSCGLCWTVFHLSCVKKWSKNEGAAAQDAARRQGQDGETNGSRAWRCPGCNLAQEIFPSSYTCWCEKEVDPRPLPGIPPHSCGQTCSRKRKGCPHPCDSTCHAGPCPPCTAMGPTQDCFCGRNSSTKRCQDTDYQNGWSCGEICGDLLPCGEHMCERPCHEGLCGACEVKIDARCYCGKVETEMLCSSKDEELDSELFHDGEVEEWTGCFGCGDICNRPFDCGVHFCQQGCHPYDAEAAHCPRSPDIVSHCPCGKTLLESIPGSTPRVSCEDPISNCSKPCNKTLPCGHKCEKICHTGPCGTCTQKISLECRCGRNSFQTICHQGTIEPPQCFRVCKAGLHCGRHACAERCCPGEQKALERQAMRRKLKSHLRPSDEDVEAEHICTRICGRLLKCGRHTCPEICHKGPCNTCREAIFEEISCNCGRTTLHPPLPCGTQPPTCTAPCERAKPCGHPQTAHNCHTDEESCPKCPFLTEKTCLCGKRTLKNQPCWLADVRCGQICGEPLKCGSHFCQKNCHRPGECEDASQPCQQACGKTKSLCGHPCTEPCHAPFPCPEKNPCPSTIPLTCPCGRLRQSRRCNAAKAVASKGQLQQPQRLPALIPLTCDDECARLERNRSLASALGVDINPSTTLAQNSASPTNLPYSSETLDSYIQLSSTCPLSTLQSHEATLHALARSTEPTQRSIRTQPARNAIRAFIHSLASDYGFASESFDPEPHRHVFILKPTSWTPPLLGLGNGLSIGIAGVSVSEAVKMRERQRAREREAKIAAAAEGKAQRDAARQNVSEGGWAQVAASKRGVGVGGGESARSTPPSGLRTPVSLSGSLYAALAGDDGGSSGKKEKLVLRSGVRGKGRERAPVEVADSWEEEVEREEKEMEAGSRSGSEAEHETKAEREHEGETERQSGPSGLGTPGEEMDEDLRRAIAASLADVQG